MAKGLNSVQIIGNLTAKPELKYTQSGTAVCNVSVAVNYSVKQNDRYEDRVEFIRCVLWNKTAESAEKYLDKGSKVFLQGRMATRSWEDKEGVKRYLTEVVVSNIIFLDSKGQGQKSSRPPTPPDEEGEDTNENGNDYKQQDHGGYSMDVPF